MDITKLINHKALVPGLLGVSVFSAGVAAGVVLERVLSSRGAKSDISPVENDHPRLFDPDNPPKPERVVITLEEALAMRKEDEGERPILQSDLETIVGGDGEVIKWVDGYNPPDYIPEVMAEKTASRVTPEDPRASEPEPVPVPFNVLESAEEEWDWDVEMINREQNPEGPYPIHEEEYASQSMGFHVERLLYYAVDDIVCSESDPREMMYDYAAKLGDVKFGYGATDEDTAFIRNPKERTDYQIVQMHDSYSESVMGIVAEFEAEQDELAHMDRPLRMRRLE